MVRRAAGRLATTERLPLFAEWGGPGVPRHRAAAVSLIRSGLLCAEHPEDVRLVNKISTSWLVTRRLTGCDRPLYDAPL